jgi:hypothetical protein
MDGDVTGQFFVHVLAFLPQWVLQQQQKMLKVTIKDQ